MEDTRSDVGLEPVRAPFVEAPSLAASPARERVRRTPCKVLVASRAPGGAEALSQRMHCKLAVEHLQHIGHLMEVAPLSSEDRVALVLDCRSPVMHPTSVAALAEELPYGWWVVAWGVDDLTWDELEPDRSGSLHWVRCPEETGWSEVADLVATLLAAGD